MGRDLFVILPGQRFNELIPGLTDARTGVLKLLSALLSDGYSTTSELQPEFGPSAACALVSQNMSDNTYYLMALRSHFRYGQLVQLLAILYIKPDNLTDTPNGVPKGFVCVCRTEVVVKVDINDSRYVCR